MSITTLPTKAIGSLGPVKTDNRAYLRPTEELPAVELEAIKDAIIENATAIGTATSPAVGSLEERVDTLEAAPAGAPNRELGSLLWEWNGLDVTEFDTPVSWGASGDADTTLAASVVSHPLPWRTDKVIQLDWTAMHDYGALLVKESALTLPSRYVLFVEYSGTQSGNPPTTAGPVVFGTVTGTELTDGCMIDRPTGFTTCKAQAIVNTLHGSTETLKASGSFDVATVARGGLQLTCTVEARPQGDVTSYGVVKVLDVILDPDSGNPPDVSLVHAISGVSTNFDNQDHKRVGFAVGFGISATGLSHIAKLAVYAHPDD